jgi:acetolactate synthase-1/3 small subunit
MGEDIAPGAVLDLDDLQLPASRHTGRRHILSILVENKPGVLARIAGLFSRRGFNIDTLAVGPTDDERISRITLTVDGARHPIDQVTKQLHKLVNVLKIRDLEPSETAARELALFKLAAEGEARGQIMQFAEIFRGGDGNRRQDRGLRGARAAVRADRDGEDGGDRRGAGADDDVGVRLRPPRLRADGHAASTGARFAICGAAGGRTALAARFGGGGVEPAHRPVATASTS